MPAGRQPRPRGSQPTIIDVAQLAGVSKSTVSRVLRNESRVSPATRERVLSASATLRYVPDIAAQRMRLGPQRSIGLVVSSVDSPIFARLNRDLHERLRDHGYHIIQEMILDTDQDLIRSQINNVIGLHVQGLIIAAGVVTDEMLTEYAARIPMVFVGPPISGLPVHNIGYDESYHGRLIIEHLAELGHESIVVQTKEKHESRGTWIRTRSAVEHALSHGMKVTTNHVIQDPDLCDGVDLVLAAEATAIVCAYDSWLFKTWRVVREMGLSVPADISLIGSDGVNEAIDLLGVTTVRHPVTELATKIAELIVALIDASDPHAVNPVHELLRGDLLTGSTGPPSHRK